jgi:pyruvate dehydrogenase E2 component (dihydrolipoamide acetyltransferase)
MAEFTMPRLGADMESGKLLEWQVKPGDQIRRGDIIATVGTEKGDIDVEVFEDGVVEQLLVQEGTEVPVGALLAIIHGKDETAPAVVATEALIKQVTARSVERQPARPTSLHAAATPMTPVDTNGHRTRVSPLARKLAEELGVDLNTIEGTGQHGAISRADVEKAAAQKVVTEKPPAPRAENAPAAPQAAAKPPAAEKDKASADFQTGMRRAIALAMARSNRDIPHYYLQTHIDMSKALKWLEVENMKRSLKDRVLPVVMMIKAVAKSLTQVPALNGYWLDDRLQAQEAIHIGFAIALRQGGLVTPAIHHADLLDMDELMAAMRDLIMRTRSGRLRSSELTDSTITLTNLGDMGVETVYGVIYPPQVALVAFGKTMDQVWVENGMLGVRPVVTATLAGDHRASDGRTGAQFLEALTDYLQMPEKLWT